MPKKKSKHKEILENKTSLAFVMIGIVFVLESLGNIFIASLLPVSAIEITTVFVLFQAFKLIAGLVAIIAGAKKLI